MQRSILLPFAALLLAVPGLRAANAISTPPEEQLTYHTDARFGRVLFIRNEAAQPTASEAFWRAPLPPSPSGPILNTADLAQPEWAGAVATAREFLRWHAGEFLDDSRSRGRQSAPSPSPEDQRRLTPAATANAFDPDTDLAPLRAERDALGMTHVRFTQTYRGLPVFGADATVHLAADGRVSSAGARLVPDIQVDVQPTLTREQAVLVAVALWQAQFQRTETPEATSTNLCLLAPGLLKNDGNPATHLVWEVKLKFECKECHKSLSLEDCYIDAHSGELREQLTRIRHLNRQIYDCSAVPGSDACYSGYPVRFNGVKYYFGRREDAPVRGPNPRYFPEISTDTDDAFDLFAAVTDYCLVRFGRNAANGQGGTGDGVNSPVSESQSFVYTEFTSGWSNHCPGAAYNIGRLYFCKGMVVPDVFGHEYAHAVAAYSHYISSADNGMVYQGESGALDESHADVFGQLFQLYYQGTNDWLEPFRNLANPPAPFDYQYDWPGALYPDRFHGQAYCGTNDHGGVHFNSTILSKSAYLLSMGGSFNGCEVIAIGSAKVEQIWYRAMTQYYSRTETFNGAYAKLIQSAADLYGADSPECLQTRRALQSVELDQPGFCSGLPARLPAALDPVGW